MGKTSDPDPNAYRFGRLINNLRRVRGLTQEQLAERSGLSADTIRRCEHGDFSASLKTIGKLARGLGVNLATLFSAFDLAEIDVERELAIMTRRLTPAELAVAQRLFSYLADLFTAVAEIRAEDEGE